MSKNEHVTKNVRVTENARHSLKFRDSKNLLDTKNVRYTKYECDTKIECDTINGTRHEKLSIQIYTDMNLNTTKLIVNLLIITIILEFLIDSELYVK